MDAQAPAFTVRQLDASDAPAMRQLFQYVFKKDMSQALWDWKYRRALSATLGVFRDGELVAHYGGMGAEISLKGEPAKAIQVCDVMVNPSVRQAVRNGSPFFLSTSAFLERFIGYNQPFLLGYGFPSDRHMALAAHLGLYAPVGKMWELHWELTAPPRQPLLQTMVRVTPENFEAHRATLDALWQELCAGLGDRIVVRKDADFVAWRYLRHPQEWYEVLLVTQRFTGKPLGLCVLKPEAERVQLMDVIGPVRLMPQVMRSALVATWRLPQRKLYTWCSEPDTKSFGVVASAQPMQITTPANIWTAGPSPEDLHNLWWLMPGDTDYL